MIAFLQEALARYNIKNFILLNQDKSIIVDNNETSLKTSSILNDFQFSNPCLIYEKYEYTILLLTPSKSGLTLVVIHRSREECITTIDNLIYLFFNLVINTSEVPTLKTDRYLTHRNADHLSQKRQLELHFAQAVRVADFNKLDFLVPKLFYFLKLDKYSIKDPKFHNYMISLISILTRIVIEEGVTIKAAYELSDKFFIMNFNELKLSPLELDFRIVYEFTKLIKYKNYSFNSPLINKAIKYILNNIYAPLTISAIAKECGVTLEYLSTSFKNVTGVTIKQYISMEKIKIAKFLLLSTELPIQDIALDLGYSDQSHFSKNFKKITNLTPTIYRKLNLS